MSESLRTALQMLLRGLSALWSLTLRASKALVTLLRPALAALASGTRRVIERLPGAIATVRAKTRALVERLPGALAAARTKTNALMARVPPAIEALRARSATLLRRMANALAPEAPTESETAPIPEPPTTEVDADFADFLTDLGAEPPTAAQRADATLEKTTIRALTGELQNLRDLGDRLARTEQERLTLAARVAELEAAGEGHAQDLERTGDQLAQQRTKTADWKRKAAERWHELKALRKQNKALERALADAVAGGQPGPLPKPDTGTKRRPRTTRRPS